MINSLWKKSLSIVLAITMIVGGISTFGLDKALALSEIEWAGAMNYNDENNNVYSPQTDLPESYDETEIQWATKVGHYDRDAYYASNTAIAGDYIYVTGDGKLNKINKSTGVIEKTVGTVKSSNTNRTDYICIVDDVLYVAADTAIEAYNLADLSVKWNYPGSGNTANLGQYHPIQYLDIAGSGYIYCNGLFLNALDGTKVTIYTDNTKTLELDKKDFAWSSGAVVNDIFYVTDKVNVYAIDVENRVIKDKVQYYTGTINSTYNASAGVVYDEDNDRLFWGSKKEMKLFSVEIAPNGEFTDGTLINAETKINAVTTPVVYDGKIYLVGQGGFKTSTVAQVFEYKNDAISSVYDVTTTATTAGGTAKVSTVQCNPILVKNSQGNVNLYLSEQQGDLYVLKTTGSAGTLVQLADTPNLSGITYPWSYEQIAMDKDGSIYCYNESGYLFCYKKASCQVPHITVDLDTKQVKFPTNSTSVTPLKVEATVSDGGTLSYQWQKSLDRDSWTNVDNATNATYTPSSSNNGVTYYRCVVTNNLGGKTASAYSDIANVLIKEFSDNAYLSDIDVNKSNTYNSALIDITPIFEKNTETYYVDATKNPITGSQFYRIWTNVEEPNAIAKIYPVENVNTASGKVNTDGTLKSALHSSSGYYRHSLYVKDTAKNTVVRIEVTSEDGKVVKNYKVIFEVLDVCKEEAKTELAAYSDLSKYDAGGKAEINTILNTAKASIDSATDCASVHKTVAETKVLLDKVKKIPAKDINVYVSIADSGLFVKGTDGTLLANVNVTAKDINSDGIINVDEVLVATHEKYYEGGAAEGYLTADYGYGLSIVKLWGDTSGCFGYWNNNASCWSLDDEVKDGAYIKAFIYKDKNNWSDKYTTFEKNYYSSKVGEKVTVKLLGAGYDANWNTVFAGLEGAIIDINGNQLCVTQKDGVAILEFDKPGTYSVTAHNEDGSIVPSICTIVVEDIINENVDKDTPTTGDSTDVLIWVLLMGIAAFGLYVLNTKKSE